MNVASAMGIELLTEEQYRELQEFGEFDQKTSSWIELLPTSANSAAPSSAQHRYDTVFTYHNGAESYYGARGFRGALKV